MSRAPFWHSYADMAVVGAGALELTRGEGSYLYDRSGKRYFDLSASLWYCMVGHGRAELAQAAADQLRRLEAYSTFGDLTNEPADRLARRLAHLAPVDDPAVFFTSGGSDSIDTAIKAARRYWEAVGDPERRIFIAREKAYHGMHIGGTSLVGIEAMHTGYGDLLPDVVHVPWDSLEAITETVDRYGASRIAGIFCEPVVAVGGVLHPPPGYLEALAGICEETGILLIADEVVTGFGRLGHWFASERFGISPDLIVCAKGVTSGYLPLGAVIAAARVAEPFYDGTVGPWRHGYTYSGHATGCAVALANLEILEAENLLEAAHRLEGAIEDALEPVAEHPLVASVRSGLGAMAAVELDPEEVAANPGLPLTVSMNLRDEGVLTRALVGGELQVSPPLITGPEELELTREAMLASLDRYAVPH